MKYQINLDIENMMNAIEAEVKNPCQEIKANYIYGHPYLDYRSRFQTLAGYSTRYDSNAWKRLDFEVEETSYTLDDVI